MIKRKGRILSVLLAVILTLTSMSTVALADEEPQTVSEDGLCEHHTQHTAECGRNEETGSPCTYECEVCDSVVPEEDMSGESPEPEGEMIENPDELSDTERDQEQPAATLITDWSWLDEGGNLQEQDGVWELSIPGADGQDPLTRDSLLDMLPSQIEAVTADGEEVILNITWDLSSIPDEGIWSGEYTFTASPDETYSLGEGVSPLSVKAELGGASVMADTQLKLPEGEPPFPGHLIDGVSPGGTTINLFDYWVTGRLDPDNNDPWAEGTLIYGNNQQTQGRIPDVQNRGINKGHALLFLQDPARTEVNPKGAFGAWNRWTGNKNPYKSIVQSRLDGNGYPALNLPEDEVNDCSYACMMPVESERKQYAYCMTLTGRPGTESLDYLFDPTIQHDGKQSYSDVKGLLQVDNEGYYYYDSTENYAAFYEDTNSFTLYDHWGVVKGNNQSENGQFFPFNAASDVMELNGNSLTSTAECDDEYMNHYFGLTMSTRFIQQEGGRTTNGTPVTYEFSGDDDVWVFIDDVLVADLGGIHDASSLKIDFSTGQIEINGSVQSQTLGDLLSTGMNTLPDNTYHTLDFFYLERGNGASNMSLKFNLVTIPESSVIKVDQTGDPVQGAEFKLYAENNPTTPIATGTTDKNGEFVFMDDDGIPITIQELYDAHSDNDLILKETEVPEGYRSAGDMRLKFQETKGNEVLLLSDNQWETGAYAMTKATATAPNTIHCVSLDDESQDKTISLNTHKDEEFKMFAVIMQKQQNGAWYPVYGDPLNGWNVTDGATLEDVKEAAEANPYLFGLASSGSYQCEIENLPGDVTTYYHACQDADNAEYAAAYYYTTAPNLAGITAENTWRIDGEDESDPMTRVFSVNLYVPNIKNRLFIQKVDDAGTPVNGAAFDLYKAGDVTVAGDGTVTLKDKDKNGNQAQPYDTATTAYIEQTLDTQGAAVFPNTQANLPVGEYYLIEKNAPEGYILNDTAVHVVIDNTGVYADAGTEEDGISVLRGVGSIVRSMVQFATDDQVDTTLNQIKAQLATGSYDNGEFEWPSDVDWENSLKLQYANTHQVLDYGLIGAGEKGDLDSLTLSTDEGWSRLYIQQYWDSTTQPQAANRENLENRDLTNLFSGSVFVRVEDQRVDTLKISKTVTDESDTSSPTGNEQFTFTLSLKKDDVVLSDIEGTICKSDGSPDRTVSDVTTSTGFTLTAGQYILIENLPVGTKYEVTETEIPEKFKPSVKVGDGSPQASSTATGNITHTIDEDTYNVVAYTNVFSDSITADFTFTKTDKNGTELAGATFAVYKQLCSDDHTDELIEVGEDGAPTDTDCWELVQKATSNENGQVEFSSLEEGSYRLVELKAPGGYVLPRGQWTIQYKDETFIVPPNSSIGNPPAYNEEDDTIINYQPGELPFSGNIGIRLFLIIGGTLMLLGGAGGVIWYKTHGRVRKRRMRR